MLTFLLEGPAKDMGNVVLRGLLLLVLFSETLGSSEKSCHSCVLAERFLAFFCRDEEEEGTGILRQLRPELESGRRTLGRARVGYSVRAPEVSRGFLGEGCLLKGPVEASEVLRCAFGCDSGAGGRWQREWKTNLSEVMDVHFLSVDLNPVCTPGTAVFCRGALST